MKIHLFYFLSLILLCSCATASKAKLMAVNEYAKNATSCCEQPSKFIDELAKLRLDSKLYYISTKDYSKKELTAALKEYNNIIETSNELRLRIAILDKYYEMLTELSNDMDLVSIGQISGQTGHSIDTLISRVNQKSNKKYPLLGGAMQEIFREVSGLYIRKKQGEAIQEVMREADPMIAELCDEISREFLGNWYDTAKDGWGDRTDAYIDDVENGKIILIKLIESSTNSTNTTKGQIEGRTPSLDFCNWYVHSSNRLQELKPLCDSIPSVFSDQKELHNKIFTEFKDMEIEGIMENIGLLTNLTNSVIQVLDKK